MYLMSNQVWLDDADVEALQAILSDESFDEIAVSIEKLQQIIDIGKARMLQPECREQVACVIFDIAEGLASLGIRL